MPQPDPLPPIMIGGGGEQKTLRAVARYADWWNLPGGSVETYAHKLDVLRQHCQAVGRNYDDIVKTWSPEAIALAETETAAYQIAEASPYKKDVIVVRQAGREAIAGLRGSRGRASDCSSDRFP